MEARQHAHLFRRLVAMCGGVDEIVRANACKLKRSRLFDIMDPNTPATATMETVAELEAYCGRPIYSEAVAADRPARTEAETVLDEACDICERAGELLATVRDAKHRAPLLDERARRALEDLVAQLQDELRQISAAAAAEGDGIAAHPAFGVRGAVRSAGQ